jgi:hypothetical protein
LHNNLDVVKLLLAKDEIRRDMQCNVVITGSGIPKPDSTECKWSERRWTTLELATMMGQLHVVGELLKVCS